MKQIRKIALLNGAGERYGFNGELGIYATGLAGFGVALNPSFADLNRGFFARVNDELEPQGTLTLTIVFTQNPYKLYKDFVDWISASVVLSIAYNPTGDQEYHRDVIVSSMAKEELTDVGWLEVPCSFYCLTPWYLPSPTSLRIEQSNDAETKVYDYGYSDVLRFGSESAASFSGEVVGAGHIPGSLEISYYGAISNPRIRLSGNISGKTYGICSIAAVLSETDRLHFSTKYENSFVKQISATGVETDLLDKLDLLTNPFFHIPVSEPCTLSMESDTEFTGTADMLVYYYYRSV